MSTATREKQELEAKLRAYVGQDVGAPWVSPDGVNEPMIRHWCEVMGDRNPVYRDPDVAKRSAHGGIIAPPTMLQTWVMPDFIPPWSLPGSENEPAPNKEVEVHRLLSSYGYTGVVGTNYEQEYVRDLRPGDRISANLVFEAISEEKATPLGIGYFIDVRWNFVDEDDEPVGTLLFRVLKYKPAQEQQQPVGNDAPDTPAAPTRLRAPKGHDNAWWWEGIGSGEILIQKCSSCGALRHPPRPMCGECQSLEWGTVSASGAGRVYSYTVLHHPKLPGYDYPLVCAVIELEEGTRIVANVIGCRPEDVHIGMPVQGTVEDVDPELKLPMFRTTK